MSFFNKFFSSSTPKPEVVAPITQQPPAAQTPPISTTEKQDFAAVLKTEPPHEVVLEEIKTKTIEETTIVQINATAVVAAPSTESPPLQNPSSSDDSKPLENVNIELTIEHKVETHIEKKGEESHNIEPQKVVDNPIASNTTTAATLVVELNKPLESLHLEKPIEHKPDIPVVESKLPEPAREHKEETHIEKKGEETHNIEPHKVDIPVDIHKPVLESHLEKPLDHKPELPAETKQESLVQHNIDSKQEPVVEIHKPVVDSQLEKPLEHKLESHIESKQETPAEIKQEPSVQPNKEPHIDPKPETSTEIKQEPLAQLNIDSKQEPPIEPHKDIHSVVEIHKPVVESHLEKPLEHKLETPVEPKQEPPVQTAISQVIPNQELSIQSKQEPPIDPKQEIPFEPKPEIPVVEHKVEPSVEHKVEQTVKEQKMELAIEQKVETIIEQKVAPPLENKVNTIVADQPPKADPLPVEQKVELSIEQKIIPQEPTTENKIEQPPVEHKVETPIEQKIETPNIITPALTTVIENKIEQPPVEHKVEIPIEQKIETPNLIEEQKAQPALTPVPSSTENQIETKPQQSIVPPVVEQKAETSEEHKEVKTPQPETSIVVEPPKVESPKPEHFIVTEQHPHTNKPTEEPPIQPQIAIELPIEHKTDTPIAPKIELPIEIKTVEQQSVGEPPHSKEAVPPKTDQLPNTLPEENTSLPPASTEQPVEHPHLDLQKIPESSPQEPITTPPGVASSPADFNKINEQKTQINQNITQIQQLYESIENNTKSANQTLEESKKYQLESSILPGLMEIRNARESAQEIHRKIKGLSEQVQIEQNQTNLILFSSSLESTSLDLVNLQQLHNQILSQFDSLKQTYSLLLRLHFENKIQQQHDSISNLEKSYTALQPRIDKERQTEYIQNISQKIYPYIGDVLKDLAEAKELLKNNQFEKVSKLILEVKEREAEAGMCISKLGSLLSAKEMVNKAEADAKQRTQVSETAKTAAANAQKSHQLISSEYEKSAQISSDMTGLLSKITTSAKQATETANKAATAAKAAAQAANEALTKASAVQSLTDQLSAVVNKLLAAQKITLEETQKSKAELERLNKVAQEENNQVQKAMALCEQAKVELTKALLEPEKKPQKIPSFSLALPEDNDPDPNSSEQADLGSDAARKVAFSSQLQTTLLQAPTTHTTITKSVPTTPRNSTPNRVLFSKEEPTETAKDSPYGNPHHLAHPGKDRAKFRPKRTHTPTKAVGNIKPISEPSSPQKSPRHPKGETQDRTGKKLNPIVQGLAEFSDPNAETPIGQIFDPNAVFNKTMKTEKERNDPVAKLIQLRGTTRVHVRQVELSAASLNDANVFVLDDLTNIWTWHGKKSSRTEKATGLDVATRLNRQYHSARLELKKVESGKEEDAFWEAIGGKKPIAPIAAGTVTKETNKYYAALDTLYVYDEPEDELETVEGKLEQKKLNETLSFILDCTHEFYVWHGRKVTQEQKQKANNKARQLYDSKERPTWCLFERANQGGEPLLFIYKFALWEPDATLSGYVPTRGNIAKHIKQEDVQKMDVIKMHRASPIVGWSFNIEDRDDAKNGSIKVWSIDGFDKKLLPESEHGQFYSKKSYIILYSWCQNEKFIIYFWQGDQSSINEKGTSAGLTTDINERFCFNKATLTRVVQYREPRHLLMVFDKKFVVHRGESRDPKKDVRLYQVRGTDRQTTRAIENIKSAANLYTGDVFILTSPQQIFIWHGKHSNAYAQNYAIAAVNIINCEPVKLTLNISNTVPKATTPRSGKDTPRKSPTADPTTVPVAAPAASSGGPQTDVPPVEGVAAPVAAPVAAAEQQPPIEIPPTATAANTSTAAPKEITTQDILNARSKLIKEEEKDELAVLAPGLVPVTIIHENEEPELFWTLLGGKKEYMNRVLMREPKLFFCESDLGIFNCHRIFDFVQADLLSRKMLILDLYDIVYLWIGKEHNHMGDRKLALEIVIDYVEKALDKRPTTNPPKVILEGNEPIDFASAFQCFKFSGKPQTPLRTAGDCLSEFSNTFSYERLQNKKSLPATVDTTRLEDYLTEEEFFTVFNVPRAEWLNRPLWKRQEEKKSKGLY